MRDPAAPGKPRSVVQDGRTGAVPPSPGATHPKTPLKPFTGHSSGKIPTSEKLRVELLRAGQGELSLQARRPRGAPSHKRTQSPGPVTAPGTGGGPVSARGREQSRHSRGWVGCGRAPGSSVTAAGEWAAARPRRREGLSRPRGTLGSAVPAAREAVRRPRGRPGRRRGATWGAGWREPPRRAVW